MIPGGRMISTPTVMPPTNDTLRRARCPHRPASGQRPPLQYTQHPFILCRRARRPGAPLEVCLLPVPWSRLPEKDGGCFAPGRGTFQGWKVPKDPRVVVLTKSAALRTPRCGHPSLRSLARPLPTTTTAQPLAALPPYGCGVPLAGTTLGRGWVPGGSAPYDFRTQSARLENGLNLFGADMNLGPLRPPPAAARIYQITRFPSFPRRASRMPCLFSFGCFAPRTM